MLTTKPSMSILAALLLGLANARSTNWKHSEPQPKPDCVECCKSGQWQLNTDYSALLTNAISGGETKPVQEEEGWRFDDEVADCKDNRKINWYLQQFNDPLLDCNIVGVNAAVGQLQEICFTIEGKVDNLFWRLYTVPQGAPGTNGNIKWYRSSLLIEPFYSQNSGTNEYCYTDLDNGLSYAAFSSNDADTGNSITNAATFDDLKDEKILLLGPQTNSGTGCNQSNDNNFVLVSARFKYSHLGERTLLFNQIGSQGPDDQCLPAQPLNINEIPQKFRQKKPSHYKRPTWNNRPPVNRPKPKPRQRKPREWKH